MFLYNYIIHPIETFYKAIYLLLADWLDSYGIAVIVLSFLSYVVLYPLTKKARRIQQGELRLQEILQKQLKEIKAKYSGEEQFKKTQRLYNRYSYHPIMAIRSVFGLLIQLPFLLAVFYMLSNCAEIQGLSWGIVSNLGAPDHLLDGINVLPFVMTLITIVYAFVIRDIRQKERIQTVVIGIFFLVLLYSAPSALLFFWTCNLIWSLLDSLLIEKLTWTRDYISKNELALHIIFAFALTVGWLVPAEIFIKNANQLWFSFKDILKYFLLDTSKYFIILLLIYIACWHKKARNIYLSVLLGLFLGVFLQSYVIGLDYGLFDGHEIDWGKYAITGITNTIVWLMCLFGAFLGFHKLGVKSDRIKVVVKPIVFCLIIVQSVVLFFILIKNPILATRTWNTGRAGILSTKDMYSVSSKNNIIIFLLDMFDASVFEEIQNKNPEVMNDFKDFTYYPDATSSYGATDYSLPEILTGEFYNIKERYHEYIEKAWNKTKYYKYLKENNYSITLYTNGNFVSKNNPIDNYSIEKIQMNDNAAAQFREICYFRMAPHFLKKIYYNYNANMRNPLVAAKNTKPYIFNDKAFFAGLKKGLTQRDNENVFRFYHLNGMHYPFVLDENVESVKEGKGTAYQQALGALKIVREYVDQLRRLNIYDATSFAVVADHGYFNRVGSRPVFLIKQPNSNQYKLIKSSVPVTVSQLMPMVLQRFKLNINNENKNEYYDYNTKRYYYLLNNKGEYLKYMIAGAAYDTNSWRLIGKEENSKELSNADRSYRIGDTIDFSSFGEGYRYKTVGWSSREAAFGSIMVGNASELFFVLNNMNAHTNSGESYTVVIEGFIDMGVASSRMVSLLANGVLVGEWNFKTTGKIGLTCKIPAKVLKSSSLRLRFLLKGDDIMKDDFGISTLKMIRE